MTSFGDRLRNVWSSLTFRVLLLLTLTIAPIGAIAVFQTSRLSETLDERAIDALLASTLKSVTPERVALERALGAADALSRTVPAWTSDASGCRAAFADVITGEDGYSFVGLLTRDGLICAEVAKGVAIEGLVRDKASFRDGSPIVIASSVADITLIGHPVTKGGAVLSYVLIEISSTFMANGQWAGDLAPDAVALVSPTGEVVRASISRADLSRNLPQAWPGPEIAERSGQVFSGPSTSGENRAYTLIPMYGDTLFALAIWQPSVAALPGAAPWLAPWIFPIFMWLATLVISYIAINRVVVRHVRHLGMHMRRFARNKMIPPAEMLERQPVEFSEINTNFRGMAQAIVQDEAELENAVHEKTLLLREVHHRVKNNLQLIASIMNMQIRRSESRETTAILRRLQDRVLGLAAIHRQMYKAQALDQVPADEVVGSILDQVVRFEHGDPVKFTRDLTGMALVQDQAVPLALLTAEAVTNAVGYLGTNAAGERMLHVSLKKEGRRGGKLTISNSIAESARHQTTVFDQNQAGLGSQLIDAFARQLGGTVTTKAASGVYDLTLSFERVTRWQDDDKGHDDGDAPAEPDCDGAEPGFPLASAASAPV